MNCHHEVALATEGSASFAVILSEGGLAAAVEGPAFPVEPGLVERERRRLQRGYRIMAKQKLHAESHNR